MSARIKPEKSEVVLLVRRVSSSAIRKWNTGTTEDGHPAHSFEP
ncbi:MAG: hypothetical protein OXC03_07910 [Flavobacteriaceae bacterium]|nr:hypothetical protein [Flavobacteriaceae bacterium]